MGDGQHGRKEVIVPAGCKGVDAGDSSRRSCVEGEATAASKRADVLICDSLHQPSWHIISCDSDVLPTLELMSMHFLFFWLWGWSLFLTLGALLREPFGRPALLGRYCHQCISSTAYESKLTELRYLFEPGCS